MDRKDFWGGIAWMIFGAGILGECLRMDTFSKMGATMYTMPALVPGIFGSLLIILGAVLALRKTSPHHVVDHSVVDRSLPWINRRVVIACAMMLAYGLLLVGRLNFMLASAMFVTAFVYQFSPTDKTTRQKIVLALSAGIISALMIGLIFERIFLVRLP